MSKAKVVGAHSAVKYPTDVPLDEIKHLVELIRGGDLVNNKAEFAKDAWIVQGFVLVTVLGEPSVGPFVGSSALVTTKTLPALVSSDADAIAVLEAIGDPVPEGVSTALPIPPELLSALAMWLIQKLLDLLNKK